MTDQPVIKIKDLMQVGLVVNSITEKMESLWRTFGIGPWQVFVYEPGSLSEVKYYGKPSHSGLKVAKAKVGSLEIELIESIGEDNIYRDFAREHGEGIQHLGWHVMDTREALEREVKALEGAGFPCIWRGSTARAVFAYVDTSPVLNTLVELIWWDKSIKAVPTYVYPE